MEKQLSALGGKTKFEYRQEFLDTSSDNVSEDMALDYLAEIIVDIALNDPEIMEKTGHEGEEK